MTLIQNRMNVIELMPEEELLALQKEKKNYQLKSARQGLNCWQNRMNN